MTAAHLPHDTSSERTVPELLAPAGNLSTALAAYESGADAVYCGLPRFNAREMGQNLSYEDLSRLAGYVHGRGGAFYVTFNTLLKEQELEQAAEDLARIEHLEPHGVIVQDLGVVRMIRELFPHLPIHASTQMGIHNSAGVEAAAQLGIQRVILERQVSRAELEQLTARVPIEVEVFVHGALCCSLSGRCLFSSWIGGWSGNRGKCKQPCRRRYYTQQEGGKRAGFFFSTQDLYSLDMLPSLVRLGVSSLKIEGRLKKPDYVQSVVSAYRMVLNRIAAGQEPDIKEAKAVLAESFGRRWSHGFATEEDRKTVIVPDNIGVSGMRIGSVLGRADGGIRVELRRKLRVGDRIRVQPESGEEGPALTVRTLLREGKKVKSAAEGAAVIPTEKELPEKGLLYRIGSSRRIPGPDPGELPLYRRPRRFYLRVELDTGGLRVTAAERGTEEEYHWDSALQVEQARNRALDAQTVREMFTATRSSSLAAGYIDAEVQNGLFVPLSALKQCRRDFWSWLGQQLPPRREEAVPSGAELLEKLRTLSRSERTGAGQSSGGTENPQPASLCAVSLGQQAPKSCGRAIRAVETATGADSEAELPHFVPEGELERLQELIAQATEGKGADGPPAAFRATDLSHFVLLQRSGARVIVTGYPLPATNSLAADELRDFGCLRVQAWVELDRPAMEAMIAASSLPLEAYIYGRPFLLATRAEVPAEGTIVDGRGKRFQLRRDGGRGLTYLYPAEVMSINAPEGAIPYRDLREIPRDGSEESSFNFEVEYV